ncbi:MAG TPA: FAD binding domain-containing protein [Streptosporangiaceae bacterium]
MKAFRYLTPGTAGEAVSLLDQHGPQARVIAGGQSLLLDMKTRTARPEALVSLAGVADLAGIRRADSGELVVGATTTYAALTRAPLTGWHTEIASIAGNLADRPVRTMGTVGGALCDANPRYDMLTLVAGTGARLEVLAPSGVRTLTADEFFAPGGGTTLAADEILAAIRFPAADAYRRVVFEKFRPRTFDAALASVLGAAESGSDRIRITVGAVRPVPVVVGAATDPAAVAAEVLGADGGTSLVQYQRELVRTLTARTLSVALSTTLRS